MIRILLAFSSAVFLGSLGAFFLFVPPLLIATGGLLLMGFMLMFWIGMQIEVRPLELSDGAGGKSVSGPVEIEPARV